MQDALNLAMCVIAKATDFDNEGYFEIHELESRESLLLKVCFITISIYWPMNLSSLRSEYRLKHNPKCENGLNN